MDKITGAAQKMGDSVTQGAGRTQHSGHAGTDAATNRGNEAGNRLSEGLDTMKHSGQEALGQDSLLDKAKHSAQETSTSIQNRAGEAVDKAKELVGLAGDKSANKAAGTALDSRRM